MARPRRPTGASTRHRRVKKKKKKKKKRGAQTEKEVFCIFFNIFFCVELQIISLKSRLDVYFRGRLHKQG